MSNLVRAPELTNALRTLLGYLDDLRRASFDDAALKLRLVINYAQKDPVVRHLSELLRQRVSTEALVERTKDQSFDPPPAASVERMAFSFTLLVHLNQRWKFDLRELLTRSAFQGAGMDGRMADFNTKVTIDLLRSLEKVVAHIEAHHATDTTVDPEQALRAALATIEGVAAPAAPVASAPVASAPVASAPVASAPVASPHKKSAPVASAPVAAAGVEDPDLLIDVELLTLELSKDRPDAARLAELEGALAAASPALGKLARTTIELGTALALVHAQDEPAASVAADDDDDDDAKPAAKPKAAKKTIARKKASNIKGTTKRKSRST